MRRIPVQVWGPAYEDRSLPFSAQTTVNLFPSRPSEGRSIRALHPWPGCKPWSTGDGPDRGMGKNGNTLYKVSGTTLYSVDTGGAQTSIGTIPGTGRCHLQGDGTHLIISTGSTRYQYDGTTLAEISDSDHEGGNVSAFINRQMVYDGLDGRFWVADVGDPDSINALSFGTGESNPDDTQSVYEFRQTIKIFGSESVEPWYPDSAVTNPPLSRIDSAVRPIGITSPHCIADDKTYVYFLGHDRHIYRTVDIDLEQITPVSMEAFLADLTEAELSDVYGCCMSFAGQWFYIMTFPLADKTWVIPTKDPSNSFQLSTGLNYGRHLMNSYIYCYGKHLVSDYRNGNIYEWDVATYTDNGETILRERTLGPLNGESLGLPGAEATMSHIEYVMETGVGNASVPSPVIQCDISYDGGRSFTNERWINLGQAGEKKNIRFNSVRTFEDAFPRIRLTEAVPLSLHSAAVYVKLAGKSR